MFDIIDRGCACPMRPSKCCRIATSVTLSISNCHSSAYFGSGSIRLVHLLIEFRPLAPTVKAIDELASLYREGVKLAEEEEKILKEEPNDVIKNIEILAALRSASETEPVRTAQAVSKPRNPKRQKIETDGSAESPAPIPSPSVVLPAARIKGTSSARSGSVPSTREIKPEPIVKLEEGSEGSKGPAGEKAGKFYVGAEVAYKQAKPKEDGSQWIQCNITSVVDNPKKKM